MVRPRFWPAALAFLLAVPAAASAQRQWRPEDRSLITSYDEVMALAAGRSEVYVGAAAGIAVYDPVAAEWRLPFAPIEGFPAGGSVSAVAWDRATSALWVGSETGELYSLPPTMDRWIRATFRIDDPIIRIVPDPSLGVLWVGAPGGWFRVRDDGGFGRYSAPDRVPPEVREQGAIDSGLRAIEGTLGLDAALRRFPLTGAVSGEQQGVFFAGTDGGGLIRVGVTSGDTEWLPYGLLSRGAGAVAIDADGLWFGGDGQGPRNGVARANANLGRWWRSEGSVEGGPAGFVARITPTADAIWFAASDGLYRLARGSLESGEPDWVRYTTGDGLPADQTTAALPSGAGVDVATLRGLAHMDGEGRITTSLQGRRVLDLARAGGTLWVATDVGLHAAVGGAAPSPVDGPPGLREGPVVAVAADGDRVAALTPDGLYTRAAGGWSGPDRTPVIELGTPLRLLLHDGEVWVGGEGGVIALGGTVRRWLVPGDIPAGPVRGMAISGDDLWVATPGGALRLDRTR